MKKKVSYASFQSAISAPGVTGIGSEQSLSTKKQKGIEMTYEAGLLFVSYDGFEVGIPSMNIKSMVFEKEVVVAVSKKAA